MTIFRRKKVFSAATILKVAGLLLLPAIFLFGLSRLNNGSTEAHRRQLEESIRRACVVCYSTEGVYPPSIAYLEQHYGIRTDPARYTIFYDIFAENLMPDITVVSKVK